MHAMVHVGQRYNSRLVYDPLYPEKDDSVFKNCDWSQFYWDAEEPIPMNAPKPQGKEVDFFMFVDSDCARDQVSQ